MHISVQSEDFNVGQVIADLHNDRKDIGAIVNFVGLVRDFDSKDLVSLTLEHYPGMTEKALTSIAEKANIRWELQGVSIIHRYGELKPADQIVLVAVASAHRRNAFQACEYIMDYLKTEAPFWKKEKTAHGSSKWVEAKDTDDQAKERWDRNIRT